MAEIITIVLILVALSLWYVWVKGETSHMMTTLDLGRPPQRKGLMADVKLKKNIMNRERLKFLPSTIVAERYIFVFIALALIISVPLVIVGQVIQVDKAARLEASLEKNEKKDHVDCERISRLEEILDVDPLDCEQIYASVTDE